MSISADGKVGSTLPHYLQSVTHSGSGSGNVPGHFSTSKSPFTDIPADATSHDKPPKKLFWLPTLNIKSKTRSPRSIFEFEHELNYNPAVDRVCMITRDKPHIEPLNSPRSVSSTKKNVSDSPNKNISPISREDITSPQLGMCNSQTDTDVHGTSKSPKKMKVSSRSRGSSSILVDVPKGESFNKKEVRGEIHDQLMNEDKRVEYFVSEDLSAAISSTESELPTSQKLHQIPTSGILLRRSVNEESLMSCSSVMLPRPSLTARITAPLSENQEEPFKRPVKRGEKSNSSMSRLQNSTSSAPSQYLTEIGLCSSKSKHLLGSSRNSSLSYISKASSKSRPLRTEHYFLNYHQSLCAHKAEMEASKYECKGHNLLQRGYELDGILLLEKTIWIRSNFASLNDGRLPSGHGRTDIGDIILNRVTRSQSRDALFLSNGTLWGRSESLVILCNQVAVKCIQTLSESHLCVCDSVMAVCERLLWAPQLLIAMETPNAKPPPIASPAILALGPIYGSDPFCNFHALKKHLLGSTLCNYGTMQHLVGAPIESIVTTFERALRVEEGIISCQTLYNLASVLLHAHDFEYGVEMAVRCIELSNHYLSLHFIAVERDTDAYQFFHTDAATNAILAHHMISAVAYWTGLEDLAIYQAQQALGCAELYLGKNHALTTRCADRLDAVVDRTFQIDFNDNEPPFVPLQMTVFSSGIRPSAIVPYATAYPFTTSLQNFFSIIVNGEPLRSEAEKSPLWKGGREMSKMGFSKDNINTSIQSMKTVAKGVIMNQFKNAKGKSMKFKKGSSVGNRNLPISIAALTNFHHTNKQRSEDRSASWDYNDDIGCARKIVLPADKLFENIPLNKEGTKETQASGSNLTWSSANSLTVRYRVPVRPLPRITNTLSTSEVFTTDAAALYITQNPLTAKAIEYINSTCNSRVLTPSPPPISKLGNINPVSNIDVSTPSFQKVTATQDYIGGGRSINTIKSPRVPPIVRDMDASLPFSGLSSDNVYKRHFRDPRDVGSIILTSDREIPEPRPAINSGTAISVIALRDHELYNTLKDDVKRYLSAIPVDQNLTTDEDGNRKRRLSFTSRLYSKSLQPVESSLYPTSQEGGRGYSAMSKYKLHKSDLELQKMSVVLPDHTIEQERQWYAAIMVIRGFLDIILAKRLKAKLQRETELESYRRFAAEVIFRSIKDYLACKRDKRQKNLLCKLKDQRDNIDTIQSVLRYFSSINEVRAKVLERQLREKFESHRLHVQHLSSCLIQSIYRGYICRVKLGRRIQSTVKLQRFWRIFLAYKQIQLLVFKKRSIMRSTRKRLHDAACIIQRFGIYVINIKRAKAEVAERERRIEAYLKNNRELYWLQFKDSNEDVLITLLHRVARGMQSRIRFNVNRLRFYKDTRAAFAIQRCWRHWKAYCIVKVRKAEKSQEWASKCSIENAKVAATDIQAVVRRFLARKEYHRRKVSDSLRRIACSKIQSFVRSVQRKQVLRVMQEEKAWKALLYLRTATRVYSATKIQALWRGTRARCMFVLYKQFVLQQRPVYVGRIQRLVRSFLAKCRSKAALIDKQSQNRVGQQEELMVSSVTRIQATWRMHVVARCLTIGRCAHPTFLKRKAAIKIQTKWRGYAAKSRVWQLKLASAYRNQELLNEKYLNIYVTKIQAIVRSKILNKRLVDAAKYRVAEKAARTIQYNCRYYLEHVIANRSAERDSAVRRDYAMQGRREEAAVKIQSLVRMKLARTLFLERKLG